MRKLSVFNFVTLDGYNKGPNEDISWHPHGNKEEHDYGVEGAQAGSTLLFGRITYEMMAAYWPSPDANRNDPEMAEGMNKAEKIVFSRTLKNVTWNNTKLVNGNLLAEVKKLKEARGNPMTLLGSGSILTQLAAHGLIDDYQFLVDPVAIGTGTSIFKGMNAKLELKLTGSRVFKSGAVLLSYQPIKNI